MLNKDVLLLLDQILEMSPGTLTGTELIAEWDSIAIIGLIALADEKFGKKLTVSEINKASTADDIVRMLLS